VVIGPVAADDVVMMGLPLFSLLLLSFSFLLLLLLLFILALILLRQL
jgi:hypothetical protein